MPKKIGFVSVDAVYNRPLKDAASVLEEQLYFTTTLG
jgi:hypothetical protein